jgi:hypothetical protein
MTSREEPPESLPDADPRHDRRRSHPTHPIVEAAVTTVDALGAVPDTMTAHPGASGSVGA